MNLKLLDTKELSFFRLSVCLYVFLSFFRSFFLSFILSFLMWWSCDLFSCEDSGDKITVYDGRDNNSKLLAVYCETHHSPKTLISSGPYLYIEFKSDRHNQLQGFAAEYTFVNSKDYIRGN